MARIFHDQPAIREHKERISWKLIKRGILNVNVLVCMVFALCLAYITMKTRKHGYAIVGCATLNVIGYSIWLASKNVQARYAAIFINSLNTATAASVIVASLSLVAYQTWENKRRERGDRDYRLRLPEDEVAILGHLHPNFRYIH
ncbi:hypothetical protein COL922a_010619 [Colletotrichum nupharicola]|nr:hypothetical protein COL922a_010619 [Colletotrichum nupharicola]